MGIFNSQIFNDPIFNTDSVIAVQSPTPKQVNIHTLGAGVSYRELRRRSSRKPATLEILIAIPVHGTAYADSMKKLKIKGTAKLLFQIKKHLSGKSSRYTSETLPISGKALGNHLMVLKLSGKKDYTQVINIFNDFLRLDIEKDKE